MNIVIMYLYCKHVRFDLQGGTVGPDHQGGRTVTSISIWLVELLQWCMRCMHSGRTQVRHCSMGAWMASTDLLLMRHPAANASGLLLPIK
jgi:hypothetical protein